MIKQIFQSIHLFNLIAFLAVLISIVVLALAGKATDLAIMTGLVGILGSFKPWGAAPPADQHSPAGTPDDPLAVSGPSSETPAPPVQTENAR